MMKQRRHLLKLILLIEHIFPVQLFILNPEYLNIKDQQTICICCLPVLTVMFRSLASVLLYLTNIERNNWYSRMHDGFIPWDKENFNSRFEFLNWWLAKKIQANKTMVHRKEMGVWRRELVEQDVGVVDGDGAQHAMQSHSLHSSS